MAGGTTLNNVAGAYKQVNDQHAKDMEALQRGANVNRAPAASPTPEPGEMAGIEDAVTKQQATNTADPSMTEKLNSVARARAKFFGE